MKKFTFGAIGIVVALAVWVLVRDREEDSDPKTEVTHKMAEVEDSIMVEMVVAEREKVLQLDSCFAEEIKPWEEVDSLLKVFCEGIANAGVLRGNVDVIAAMDAVRYNILKVRYNDLKRIIQLNGDEDPASDEMVEYKERELSEAMDLVIYSLRNGPIYQSMIDSKEQLPMALEKWTKTREKYKGSNAITIHEMVNVIKTITPDDLGEEAREVEDF